MFEVSKANMLTLKKHNAFTLIELMVVVMILAILTISVIPSFSSYLRNQTLKQAEENLKSDLRSLQNKALTGTASDQVVGTPGASLRYWGATFTNNGTSFTAFASTANNVCSPTAATVWAASIATIPISGGINSGSSCNGGVGAICCIFFDMSNGDLNEIGFASTGAPSTSACSGDTGITLSSNNSTRHICFNEGGLISAD
jgi:prepilin-type N-terminal cleavage/methylation domain-containing protein